MRHACSGWSIRLETVDWYWSNGAGAAILRRMRPPEIALLMSTYQRPTHLRRALESIALQEGAPLKAALLDFARNLLLGAVPDTVGGLAVVFPYGTAAYRGWVGGIVSVDSAHVSRLADPREAIYYIVTLILQLIPYSLAGGIGVNLGLAYLRPRPWYQGDKWYIFPKEAVLDTLRVYILIVPLFLVASLWEFLAR